MASSEETAAAVDSVTMLDVLDEEKEIQEETAAVLGGSDEKNCTYSKGAVKRQALYSCLTCVPLAKEDCTKACGVCLACSYACHEGHELVELYTKRNFRCDCGTPKMGKACSLEEKPAQDNETNSYNQNYAGLYCTCHRPYPDPEGTDEDEMIQCIVCEDWFHSLHLGTEPSAAQDYGEMICGQCVERVSFLKDYTGLCVCSVSGTSADQSNVDLDVTTNSVAEEGKDEAVEESAPEAKRQKLDSETPEASASDSEKCRRPTNPGNYTSGATYWPDNWRQQLCVCSECRSLYQSLGVEYLVDPEDTVKWYGDEGLKKLASKGSDYERGMRQLSSLDRVRQIDAITAYNKMKDRLKDYLNQFVASQQVVTEADIKRFFAQMRSDDQSDLLVHSNIPSNCR